ncbi:MAG: carbon monoxide dehydrogenase, partial [Actinomycetes bacterium]
AKPAAESAKPAEEAAKPAEEAAAGPSRPAVPTRSSRTAEEEALDLLEVAGAPVLKRVLPAVGALAAIGLVIWLIRRLAKR